MGTVRDRSSGQDKLTIFAVEGVGDDPLRATGAVLLELPAVVKRIELGKAQIFRVHPRAPLPEDAWKYFREAANRRGASPTDLYDAVKVTDTELTEPILDG